MRTPGAWFQATVNCSTSVSICQSSEAAEFPLTPRAPAVTDNVPKWQEAGSTEIKSQKYLLRMLWRDRRNARPTLLPWASLHTSALTGNSKSLELSFSPAPCRARGLIAMDWNITIFKLLLPSGTLSMQGCPGHTRHRNPYSTQSKDRIKIQTPRPWLSIKHQIYNFKNQHWPSETLMLIATAFHCLS